MPMLVSVDMSGCPQTIGAPLLGGAPLIGISWCTFIRHITHNMPTKCAPPNKGALCGFGATPTHGDQNGLNCKCQRKSINLETWPFAHDLI